MTKTIERILMLASCIVVGLAVVLLIIYDDKKAFNAGYEAGKAEVQTPAYIVNTCSAWWFGSEHESKKMIDKYCEVKK